MHDTAFRIGCRAMDIYSDLKTAKILEIGSYDVNGSLRDNALPTTHYVGVDMEAGPGVDVVIQPGKPLPFDDESFDFILASSVFEHDAAFWVTFVEMCRKAKMGGYVYINAPSNGTFHRYPEDHWRFYPDSGLALARWATSQGQDITLVESFVADRSADVYNDFVAVFRKGPSDLPFPDDAIYKNFACWNVHTWHSTELVNPRDDSEDTVLVTKAHQEIEALRSGISVHEQRLMDLEGQLLVANSKATDIRAECIQIELQLQEARRECGVFGLALKSAETRNDEALSSHREELNEARQEHAQLEVALRHQLQDKEHQLAQLTGELKEEAEKLAEERAELVQLCDKLTLAENLLAQRQEEQDEAANCHREDLDKAQHELAQVEDALRQQLQNREHQLTQLTGELNDGAEKLAQEQAELAQLRDRLALAENMLAQRQEEIEQTRADLAAALEQASLAVAATDNIKVKLQDANEWVFRLAGERLNADAKARLATKRLADAECAYAKAKANAERTEKLLVEGNRKLRSVSAELDELKQENEARASEIEHLIIRNRALQETETALAASEFSSRKQLSARFSEISKLTALLKEHEQQSARHKDDAERAEKLFEQSNRALREVSVELVDLKQANDVRTKEIESFRIHNRELQESETALAASEASAKKQLSARFGEISTLTALLKEREEESATHKDNAEWLQQVNIATHNRPRWWQLMPRSWRRRREHQRLTHMALFDASAYLERYPDVAANGMDPLRHYILHGMAEARKR